MAGMICLFQGRRGSGKTLSMTWWSIQFRKLGWKIYSNYSLKDTIKIDSDFLINLINDLSVRDCVILIDELQLYFDSRQWKANNSIAFTHFIQQIRKRNIIILGTTQYIDTIEKRVRQHLDVLIKPKYDEETGFCSLTVFDMTSLEDSMIPDFYELAYYCPPVFEYYDTNEIL